MRRKKPEAKNENKTQRVREIAERLTFLERLVLRVLPDRQVPKESGVQFAIRPKPNEDGICLIFQVDDPKVPLVGKDELRPDYLVVFVSSEDCIITIVEMKGREENNVEHGVDQIRAMHKRLRDEMASCLPGSWRRAAIQGILLTPFGANVSKARVGIEAASRAGLEILPLQFDKQAQLYPYISKRISRTERYAHAPFHRDCAELNPIESLIAHGKLEHRVRDSFFRERRGGDEDTFFLNFRSPKDSKEAYLSLSASTKDAMIGFSPAAEATSRMVNKYLTEKRLRCPALEMPPRRIEI